MELYYVMPQQFGASADGIADDTQAIISAANEAAESGKTLFFPAGIYRTQEIKVPAAIEIRAQPTWSYRKPGRTVLIPASDSQRSILNVSDALGTTLFGIALDGCHGRISPYYGIITEECSHCVISGNAMLPGAVKELIHDKGGHGDGMVIENNTGAVLPEKAYGCQDPFTPVHFMSEGDAPWYSEMLAGENND